MSTDENGNQNCSNMKDCYNCKNSSNCKFASPDLLCIVLSQRSRLKQIPEQMNLRQTMRMIS